MSERNRQMEERVSHLHNAVEELSDVVARQDAELRALTRRVELLIRREAERQAEQPGAHVYGDERPPHY